MNEFILPSVAFILFMHFVADFVAQSHWMATNKSKSNIALSIHVSIYSVIMTLGFLVFYLYSLFSPIFVFGYLFIGHFVIDYITSRMTSYLWSKGDIHNFFVVIGYDQFLHHIHILLLIYLIMNG